ncbi:MAG TPA: alpha/beta hydrolase [Galbitalea sp.]|jgi:pimeloyl-ACP methyl ester carboxylesterase|nr:alpha/beta hydrolase [Galbitalea sp.]
MNYQIVTASVRGGELTAGAWGTNASDAVLALHGVTASHVSWRAVARALEGLRMVVAPDLRGRGGSRALPGPFGMAQHAEDAVRLLDSRGIDRVDVVGHSMGAFVALRFATDYPDRTNGITLVDGGVPLQLPPDIPIDEVMKQALGPALARLEVSYPSRDAYRDFWRVHPAFVGEWNDDVEAYVDYDLVGTPPELRSSASGSAALADSMEQGAGTRADEPWAAITRPITLLTAPRGLLNGAPLYAPEYLAAFERDHANLAVVDVADVNHYSIVMNPRGADAVAAAIQHPKETA